MKKLKYLLLILLFLGLNVKAKILDENSFVEEYNLERAYIVGNYVFDLGDGFNPTLKDLLIAASHFINKNVTVYEVKISKNVNDELVKEYRELLSNNELDAFPEVDVKYIYTNSIDSNAGGNDIDSNMALVYGKTNAKELLKEEYTDLNIDRAYVLGEYMFNLDNGFNPTLKDLLIASTTAYTNQIKVYELKSSENISGEIVEEYNELLANQKLNDLPKVGVKYIYSKSIENNTPDVILPYYDVIMFNDVTKTYTAAPIIVDSAISENNLVIDYEFYSDTSCSGNPLSDGTIDVGEYGVLATSRGTSQYLSSSACAVLTVEQLDASDSIITFTTATNTYSGSEIEPTFTVVKDGITLVANVDYTYSYSNNINVGNGELVVNYIGNYKGSSNKEFTISKLPITVYPTNDTKVYDDEVFTKDDIAYCNVKAGSHLGNDDVISSCVVSTTDVNAGNRDLSIDELVISKDGVDVTDNYDVTYETGTVNITKRATTCSLSPINKIYDGEPLITHAVCSNLVLGHREEVTKTIPEIVDVADSAIISLEQTDIKITRDNTVVTSNYEITIANGGQVPLVVQARRGDGNSKIIVSIEYDHVTGDNTPKTPRIMSIYDEELGVYLEENESYNYTYFNNINVGTAEIRISFKGNYTGEKIVTFVIE